MPAASNATRIASSVAAYPGRPASIRVTVAAVMLARLARSQTRFTAATQLLSIEGATFSFQRYRSTATGLVDRLPTSLGTLPLFARKSRVILPVDVAEAFWIGICRGSLDVKVVCSATLRDGSLVTLHGTTDHILGIAMERERTASLTRTATPVAPGVMSRAFDLETDDGNLSVVVHLTSYETFGSEAGFRPKPLDPDAGYKGHRLP